MLSAITEDTSDMPPVPTGNDLSDTNLLKLTEMSTSLAGAAPKGNLPKVDNMRVAIVAAEWNGHITSRLTQGAMEVFKAEGFADDQVDCYTVPGAVELTFAASQLIESSLYDAVIVFGCVIRGGTPHFDYVCQSVTQGVTALNADCDIPVIFGAPGNPIFMLAARFFVNFAGGDMSKAALMVNSMSALLSAGTILLLFWTITHLTKRLIVKDDATEISLTKMLVIFGSGLCGALMYAWSDTFWFSAVEGEVYAFSSFCTALVFWLILKWENRADLPHSDRYLVLIAFIIGVSIAVHLLNLLCIPAIVLVIYYRKFRNTTATGSLIALAVSAAIIALILFGLVPGFIEVAQYFELFFVNVLGWSYNMGVLVYAVLLVAVMIWSIRELYRQRSANAIRWSFLLAVLLSGIPFIGSSLWIPVVLLIALAAWLWGTRKLPVRILTVAALSILVIFVGYSSYALLLIRSHEALRQLLASR